MRSLLTATFVAILALTLAVAAVADDIPQLEGQITDRTSAQVLASGRSRMQPVLDELVRTDDIQLFVLFVETTAGRTVTDFADTVAATSSLGGNDALLVVAMTDRTDALWRSDYLDRLTDRELETVLSQQVEPLLRDGDYAGAVIAAAYGLRSASRTNDAAPSAVPTATPAGALPDLGFLIPIALVVIVGVFIWVFVSERRRQVTAAAASRKTDQQRAAEANTLLIRADETLRDAQQEMGYAEAQFGEDDLAPYREAVATAGADLKAAFTMRQQLDDAVPEGPEARRALVEGIVARASKALSLLEAQRTRIEEMRELERRAPELLAQLPAHIGAASARLPDAERTLAGFVRYAEQSWSSVKRNVVDARDLLSRATVHVADGQLATQRGDAAAAAKAVRDAQQDLTEAVRLIDGIAAVARAIADAQASARDQLAAVSADVQKAAAAVSPDARDHEQTLATARAALASAESALSSPTPDYLAAVKLAGEAGTSAAAILSHVREETERRERETRVATTQLQVARDAYRRAADYIAPRRRTIGSTARTRLAEAERHLSSAQQLMDAGDHGGALHEAQQAQRLADEASSLAEDDVREAESKGPWTGFPRGGPVFIPFPFPVGGPSHGPFGGGGVRPPISVPRPGGRSVGGRW